MNLMKGSLGIRIFFLSFVFLYAEHETHAISYNNYATTKCLREPQRASYGGGIIVNPEFEHGIKGWELFGRGKLEERLSKHKENRNKFIAVLGRTTASDSFSQKVQVKRGKVYAFSAWVQMSEGSDSVAIVFKPNKGDVTHGGWVMAQSGCWTMLKGGIFANFSSTMEIYFESKNVSLEIWVDSVSLQPFTKQQWRSHQDGSISKVRKSTVRLQITRADKTPLVNAQVKMKNTRPDFPFGCGMNHYILTLPVYQTWFASRFKVTTFTNEMKWYSTEKSRGEENYTVADAMVDFAQKNEISIRGHNVFWDDPKYQPHWVNNSLTPEDLRAVSEKRINSVVSRYRGKLISWDIMNENLHFRFFEEKLGPNASAEFYYKARDIDPMATVFLNEYNTIEYSNDEASSPANYQKKIEEIMSFSGGKNDLRVGIGVQGHFGSGQPNLAYMRSALDVLGSIGLPMWLTEVNVQYSPHQAEYLEEILREAYSHPAVQGIIMFAGPKAAGFNATCLADENFKNTPAGDVVDKLIREWHGGTVEAISDGQGFVEMSLFHGDYDVTVEDTNSTATMSFRVTNDPQETLQVQIDT